jgi:hypothetical protein
MREALAYLRLTGRVLLREDVWVLLVPVILFLIVGAWTLYFLDPNQWDPATALAQAEILGPFLIAFLGAGLLDPERRRGAGEIVFSKPHPPALLLAARLGLATLAAELLIFALLLVYRFRFGSVPVLQAIVYSVPPTLFIGTVALTAGQFCRSAAAGFAVPLAFWFWDSTFGLIYNPLFALEVGGMEAQAPPGSMPVSVAAAKSALLAAAAFLFWINTRHLARMDGRL